MKFKILVVSLLIVILLFALVCTHACAEGEVLPWGVERIRAYCAWDNNRDMVVDDRGVNGSCVTIAVIDTGIDYWTDEWGNIYYHPDLADNVAEGRGFFHKWWSCEVVSEMDHEDGDGHGTMVAGIIAAVDNEVGVIGTAPKAKIYAIRYRAATEEGYVKAIVAAINYSVTYLGVKIISMSLGFSTDYPQLRQACDNAYIHGALLIAASSNENGPVLYPAAYESVIAVVAVYPNDTRWEDSNFGPELELVAPGVNIYSTSLNGGYATANGTSFAVPHVTGAAALIFSSKIDPKYDFDLDENWDNNEVRQKLRDTALDLGPRGKDDYYGYGLVNAWYANQRPSGDVNNDHYVNIKDVVIVSNAFGSTPSDPNWDPRADIIIDNAINIKDMVIVQNNYGKSDP